MDRDNVRERLFKVISELQNQKIEIMKLLGKSTMRIVKFNKEYKESTFDLKILNKKLLKKQIFLYGYHHTSTFNTITMVIFRK